MQQTHTVMAVREAQGLQLVVLVRLAFGLAFAPGDLALVQQTPDLLVWLLVLLAFVGIGLLFIRQLRRRRHVNAIGVAGALFDVLLVAGGTMVWTRVASPEHTLWASRSLIPMGAMLMILINGLALRPRYPIIVTAGTLVVMAVTLVSRLLDPALTVSEHFMELQPGPGEISPGLYGTVMLMVAVAGAVTAIITGLSRKTVHRAVQLERLNTALAESQAEVVIEQKIAALTQLAAGLSHELNTPLGAMSSTADTTARLTARVRKLLREEPASALPDDHRLWRTLDSLEQSARVTHDAGERIVRVTETLRQFIRLDQSERKSVDLREMLEETLSLLGHQLRPRIKIQTRFDELPPLTCYPRRLNQVFHTIIRNAAESIDGQGTITIAATAGDGEVQVRISDTGRGIAAERLERLFDVQLSPDSARVHAAMGLPIARSVVQRHGGRVAVHSEVGRGTTFTIDLPLTAPEPASP